MSKSRTGPSKKKKKKKLVKSPTMVVPVTNPPEKEEENGGVLEKPSFSSPSTTKIPGINLFLSDESLRSL